MAPPAMSSSTWWSVDQSAMYLTRLFRSSTALILAHSSMIPSQKKVIRTRDVVFDQIVDDSIFDDEFPDLPDTDDDINPASSRGGTADLEKVTYTSINSGTIHGIT